MPRIIPPQLPRDTACTGAAAGEWAAAILEQLAAPVQDTNVYALAGWFHREGGGGENNPMNTTLRTVGATGAINHAGVEDYATPLDGVAATVETMHGYPAIVLSLRAGHGLTGAGIAAELREWSGGGYDAIAPVVVPFPPAPFTGTFTAELALTPIGAWSVRGTHNRTGVKLGGPDTWHPVTVAVNRSTGEWRVQ